MALVYENLDDQTRQFMLQELDRGDLYMSPRLNASGRQRWISLLRQAAERYDDEWLAQSLRSGHLLNPTLQETRGGKSYTKSMPSNAPETLAEGQFNRLYIRGLCARAIASGIKRVIVYRGRASSHPRPESEAMIGKQIEAQLLLDDLRSSEGKDPAVLPYVNSGLTVRLV